MFDSFLCLYILRVMKAKIYRPEKVATQSGLGKTRLWVLEYDRLRKRHLDPLTGWVGSDDMRTQVKITFATLEEAKAYAEREGLSYEIAIPSKRVYRRKTYMDNFAPNRRDLWTH